MNTGTNDTINSTQILSRVKSSAFLDIKTADQDATLIDLVVMGIELLKVPSQTCKRQMTLDVECGKAPLPCGFLEMIALYPHCGDQYFPFVYIDIVHFKQAGIDLNTNNRWRPFTNSYQIENGMIWLHNNNWWEDDNEIDNDNCNIDRPREPTQLDIFYTSANLDDNGLPYVYKSYENALVYFVASSWGLGKMPLAATWDRLWRSTRLNLKALEVQDDYKRNKLEIVSLWNAMVVNPTNFRW